MSASSFFPTRWAPMPGAITPDLISSSSSSPCNGRHSSPLKRRSSSGNLISLAWRNIKCLFVRPHHNPVRHLELVAETNSYSQLDLGYSSQMLSTFSSGSIGAIGESDISQTLMSGAVYSHCNGSNIKALGSDTAMDLAPNTVLESKKSFDLDWKDIRQRLERKIASAAAHAISGRPGGADNRKPRWATPPKQKDPRVYHVKQEDKLTTRGANPRTGVVSPSNATNSSCEDHGVRPRVSQKWKVNGDQWVSVDIAQTPSPQPSPLSYKLAKTISSTSSESADNSSSDGWEDRFVVHMPSANDPNPPSMTAEQIRTYQEKIGKLHAAAVNRHEMDASKPLSGSPPPPPQNKKISSIPVLQKAVASHSFSTESSQSISPPVDGPRQYFSPDEIGRDRVSPVTDNPKFKQKDLLKKLREECFMGCLGVDEAGAKNPDEILLFSDQDEEDGLQISPTTNKYRPSAVSGALHTWKLPQASDKPLSRAPQRTLNKQRTTPFVTPLATTSQPTKLPKHTANRSPNSAKEEDTASANAPIKRAANKTVPPKTRTHLGSKASERLPRPFNNFNKLSTDNDLFFESSSPVTSARSVDSMSNQRKVVDPKGISKSSSPDLDQARLEKVPENSANSPSGDNGVRLSPGDIFKDIHARKPQIHEIISPEKERAQNGLFVKNQKVPKTPNVAELDGLQVPQQLPSPPLSTSPSPPPSQGSESSPISEKSYHREKRDTHTIRMEIRMKAEKARQGAAAAKSASDRLMAARKHAERLAEARAAYDRVKARNTANTAQKIKEPLDKLQQQRLNTEKINELRKAYKAAKAKEEAEARRNEVKPQPKTPTSPIFPSTTSQSSVPANDPKPIRKPAPNNTRRQPTSHKHDKHKDVDVDKNINKPNIFRRNFNNVDLPKDALYSGALCLSIINIHDLIRQHKIYLHIISHCENLFHMATHCFKVCKRLAEAWMEYRRTGVLPRSCVDDFGQFAGDIGQALVNFVVLCSAFIVIVKTAGYILTVTSWILWFCKPFRWVFRRFVLGGMLE